MTRVKNRQPSVVRVSSGEEVGALRGALTDDNGLWDIAYISLAGVGVTTLGAIFVMCGLAISAHMKCDPQVIVAKTSEVVTIVECKPDLAALGSGIGSAAQGFALALGALGLYMAATRKPAVAAPTTVTQTTTVE